LPYKTVKRFSGPHDHGVDVAGFETDRGFEGPWDCFQCKHYKDALEPMDAWPEIYKVIRHVCAGYYTLPNNYNFVAPRGLGPTLAQLLCRPTAARIEFIRLVHEGKVGPIKDATEREAVAAYAAHIDFSLFKGPSVSDVVEQHRKSPYHSLRFSMPLPLPPQPTAPPTIPVPEETRYLQQLFRVYAEKFGCVASCVEDLTPHERAIRHLRKQREYFYCAETFRMFYRDKVPKGTFEHLQNEMEEGVLEVHNAEHPSGFERLEAVLVQSQQISTINPLISVWQVRDKKGICHQLANDDKLTWSRQ
jgi:hypothetical protein